MSMNKKLHPWLNAPKVVFMLCNKRFNLGLKKRHDRLQVRINIQKMDNSVTGVLNRRAVSHHKETSNPREGKRGVLAN
jgi:hypothetical protein